MQWGSVGDSPDERSNRPPMIVSPDCSRNPSGSDERGFGIRRGVKPSRRHSAGTSQPSEPQHHW